MRIVSIPIRSDNYMYLICSGPQGTPGSATDVASALIVDPGMPELAYTDPPDVETAVEKIRKAAFDGLGQEVAIVGILTTHRHKDHGGGNVPIVKAAQSKKYPLFPVDEITVYGGSKDNVVTNVVKDNDEIPFGDSIKIKCLATPCHTQDSISYYVTDGEEKAVFTGDTLFPAGCGRFFEGTPEEMHAALSYLGRLPDNTIVYSGHEYTADNLKFAKTIEPDNPAFQRLQKLVDEEKITAGKTTIRDEKEWNVFMRLDSPAVQSATGKSSTADVMQALRDMKNRFK